MPPALDSPPTATGVENTKALQRAVDGGGTIVVSRPGTYSVAGTVYLGGNTTLKFGNAVFLKKVAEQGLFSHVFVNKGAVSRTCDEHIAVEGLQLIVNGVDARTFKEAYGLHGQLAFFHAKDIRIEHFRCLDLGAAQYGIQVCTFEDLLIRDVIIRGQKDGVHLGCGKRFTIRDGVFATGDDAIALNAHDYSSGNPELGWIENGLVENCHDLAEQKNVGFFCRILAGAWTDWKSGMEVQQSDTVVSEGRLYRVQMQPDGTTYKSLTKPTHKAGSEVLDGIRWGVVQTNATYSAGVRNVTFRDIFLEKPRTAFSIHFDNDKYSRSYYPGAPVPVQEKIVMDNVRVLYGDRRTFLNVATPVDVVTMSGCTLKDSSMRFVSNKAMNDYGPTSITMVGCTFAHPSVLSLLENGVPGKRIGFKTFASTVLPENFSATVVPGGGVLTVDSDLPGLKK